LLFARTFSLFPVIRPQFPALRQPFYFETGLSRGSNEVRHVTSNPDSRKAEPIDVKNYLETT
jgi:hypothetical protein